MLRKTRFLRRLGHRGSVLVLFAALCLTYGAGLASGYQPTFAVVYRVHTTGFGWAFIAIGLFTLTGAPSRDGRVRRDAVQYAVAEWTAVAWALLLSTHFREPSGWAAGMSWAFIALGLLVSSAWPNAPRTPRVRPPPLPTLEELIAVPGEEDTPP